MNDKKKIAIIGASYFQVPLIQKAKEMGLETHVFAWKSGDEGELVADYFYPISIIEKDEILCKCREIGVDGICSIASDLAVVTVNYVADKMGLIGNNKASTLKSTNKFYMRKAFCEYNIPSAEFMYVNNADDIVFDELKYPLIIKPVDRSGSRGIFRFDSEDREGIINGINDAIGCSLSKSALIESFIHGQEYSVECITWEGMHTLLAITKKYTSGAPHYIETGHLEPADLDAEIVKKIEKNVFNALDCLEVEYGASHSEIKINGGDIRFIEIGARMGGDFIGSSLVYNSTGIDYVKAVIDCALGKAPNLKACIAKKACGVRFVFGNDDVEAYSRLKHEHPEYIIDSDISFDSLDKAVVDSSARHGFFVMSANNPKDLEYYMPFVKGAGDLI